MNHPKSRMEISKLCNPSKSMKRSQNPQLNYSILRWPTQTHLCHLQKRLNKDNNRKLIQQAQEIEFNL